MSARNDGKYTARVQVTLYFCPQADTPTAAGHEVRAALRDAVGDDYLDLSPLLPQLAHLHPELYTTGEETVVVLDEDLREVAAV